MKKLLIALGLGALMMGTTVMAENNAAITIHEDGIGSCYAEMRVPGYDLPLIFVGTDVHVVSNKNKTKTICKLDIPEVIAGLINLKKAYKTSDFACRVMHAFENRWVDATRQKFIWTPGNQAKLSCSYKVKLDDGGGDEPPPGDGGGDEPPPGDGGGGDGVPSDCAVNPDQAGCEETPPPE